MLEPNVASKRWRELVGYINKIQETTLKKSMLEYYKIKANEEWGYCPDGKAEQKTIELPDDIKDIIKRIKTGLEYGFFPKDKSVEQEAKIRMNNFINKGGSYSNLPNELQNGTIAKLYLSIILDNIQKDIKFLEQ